MNKAKARTWAEFINICRMLPQFDCMVCGAKHQELRFNKEYPEGICEDCASNTEKLKEGKNE